MRRAVVVGTLALAGVMGGCAGLADRFKADPIGTSNEVLGEAGGVVETVAQYPAPAGIPAWVWVLGTGAITVWAKLSSAPKDKAKVKDAELLAAEAAGKVSAASEIASGVASLLKGAAAPVKAEGE